MRQGAATWVRRHANVEGTDPAHVVADLVKILWDGCDVLVLNELHTDEQRAAVADLPDSSVLIRGQLAIAWRRTTFHRAGSSWEESNGGISHVTPTRGQLGVLLEHVAEAELHWELVDHVVQHIESGGKARVTGQISGQNTRGKRHIGLITASTLTHVRGGRLASDKLRGTDRVLGLRPSRLHSGPPVDENHVAPAMGSADLNIDYKAEKHLAPERRTPWFPYTTFTKAGLTIVVPTKAGLVQGTHGGRCIDQGWILNE